MDKRKAPHRLVALIFFLLISLFAALPALGVETLAETKELKSVIEGMRVRQIGGDDVIWK